MQRKTGLPRGSHCERVRRKVLYLIRRSRTESVNKGGGFEVEKRSDGVLLAVLDTKKNVLLLTGAGRLALGGPNSFVFDLIELRGDGQVGIEMIGG